MKKKTKFPKKEMFIAGSIIMLISILSFVVLREECNEMTKVYLHSKEVFITYADIKEPKDNIDQTGIVYKVYQYEYKDYIGKPHTSYAVLDSGSSWIDDEDKLKITYSSIKPEISVANNDIRLHNYCFDVLGVYYAITTIFFIAGAALLLLWAAKHDEERREKETHSTTNDDSDNDETDWEDDSEAEEFIPTIEVKYLSDTEPIEYVDGDYISNWIDLRTAEDVELKASESALIHLGVAMKLPEGYEAILAPRSSTFKKYGIIQTNSIGVIDESYCGDNDEWMLPVIATRDIKIEKGTRIAQFRIIEHQPIIEFKTVTNLNNPSRGGIGSTGER